ncbi:hypothetical protein C2E23DRAFT_532801 [Lenzites betulinus]|nr:hypothetical protein C2E23DRAFT_532801 [Lenzites betulinus]
MELARFFDKDGKGTSVEIPLDVRQAVHEDMKALMGLRERVASGPGKKKAYVLPAPLGPDEETQKAGDGSRIYNPDWYADVDIGVNQDFVNATVALVQQNAAAHHLEPLLAQNDRWIRGAAVGYFKSLKRKYQAEHEQVASAKHALRLARIKEYQRRHRKADILRMGIEALREVFGVAATVGIEATVCTPCQSDEADTDGEATPEAREACRRKADVAASALKVRTLLWRSPKLTRLYIVLAVFARFAREHEDIQDLQDAIKALVGNTPEADLSDELAAKVKSLRTQYRTKVEVAVKGWSTILVNPSQRFERFRGPAANSSDFPPTNLKKNTLYQQFLGEEWATKSPKNSRFYARASIFPDESTIFDLELPDTLIPVEDREWLVSLETRDDIMEDGEGEGGAPGEGVAGEGTAGMGVGVAHGGVMGEGGIADLGGDANALGGAVGGGEGTDEGDTVADGAVVV